MQDNARPHVAGVCQQFLQDEGIDAMDWPARSPDLNPIEHIWDIMSRSIHQRHVAPQTVQELADALVQGTVTEVVTEGAGLYVIDKKVGLCLAYQPTLRRRLRAGDCVELHHVHFLHRPCPDFPPSMLCTCLRSSLRVTSFSRVGGSSPDSSCPGDGVLPRLLLEKNMGVSEYLWACHLSSQLSHSLVPSVLKQQCVCVLSWKLTECVWRRGRGGGRRDIYSEMLDEPHTCPLTQYSVDPAVHQYISLSELSQSLQSESWSLVPLSSLLPPSLSRSQINTALAWSCRTMTSFPQTGNRFRQRPLLLVGVLELPSLTSEHTLQLRDRTGAVACVATETSEEEEGGQRAAFNTAWIGCLVCVQQFTMVTERFIQSDFPSYQHLDQDKYIMHKHCRVEHKEGVAWKNEGAGIHRDEAGLIPCFSVRAAVIGPVVSWGRDPKNGPMTDRETETETEDKLVLLFSGVSARWSPPSWMFLQTRRCQHTGKYTCHDVTVGGGAEGWTHLCLL
ncbi:hypothetical protein L3Q82_003709 [Scortum barcoo]|uniref:Uncharacterized protein n=1 Tax=Scortum barcoo TaxID=214431 RepID=A0ACB8X6A4_9TELE|nr:hypothetical protein L3Q82_003709 [Scortum barcoo]